MEKVKDIKHYVREELTCAGERDGREGERKRGINVIGG